MTAILTAVAVAGTAIGLALFLLWGCLAMAARLDDHEARHHGTRRS